MLDDSRRFTDREVALVLKRATTLEETREEGLVGGGITLGQLKEIAQEVGLDPRLVTRAAQELDTRGGALEGGLLGPPSTHKSVVAVSGNLNESAMKALINVVDQQVHADGLVTEALGSVRWTGRNKFFSTQVSFSAHDDETHITVKQRCSPRIPLMLHAIPSIWGTSIALATATAWGLAGGLLVGAVGVGLLGGLVVGRGVWYAISRMGEKNVRRLSDELAETAKRLAETG